ncbi:MAG: DUF4262 domain-containing protein [Steroidobacteraceae bacterium]
MFVNERIWRRRSANTLVEHCRAGIEQFGYVICGVAGAFDEYDPATIYTVGLEESFGHPELLMVGLHDSGAWEILTELVERYIEGNKPVPIGKRIHRQDPDEDAVYVKPVRPGIAYPYMPITQLYYADRQPSFRVLQVIWPSPLGEYPWKPDYDQEVWPQPCLFARRRVSANERRVEK